MYRVSYKSGGAGFLPSTVAMEHGHCEDVFPIENGGFSIATLEYTACLVAST